MQTASPLGCGSSKPHAPVKSFLAWLCSPLIRDSYFDSEPRVRPATKAASAALIGTIRVEPDRQRFGVKLQRRNDGAVRRVGEGLNLASHRRAYRGWPTGWHILHQSQVRSILVVVAHVFCHKSRPSAPRHRSATDCERQCALGDFPCSSPPTPHRNQTLSRDRTRGIGARGRTTTLPASAARSREH
jgi:hypothetical protein